MKIDAVVSLAPERLLQCALNLPDGSTLQDAQSAIAEILASDGAVAEVLLSLIWGVWGRQQPTEFVLHEGDRVEAYRALKVNPKVARRERFAKQGARGTGLFVNRRKNSKPGY